MIVSNPDLAVEEAKATILLFLSMLNEKQRRLYAGLESLKLGHKEGFFAGRDQPLFLVPYWMLQGRFAN